MDKWPNFFIVGSGKAGTSSLYEYLKQVPDIFMSPEKEPNYFSHIAVPKNVPYRFMIRDKKKYLELFKNVKNEKIIGEATPTYLKDPNAANLIHEVSPHAKILITLRNPIDRNFSAYLMTLNLGRVSYSIEELVESIEKHGRLPHQTTSDFYTPYVKRYLDIFGEKYVKIIIFEEWIKNVRETIMGILEFLGVDNNNLTLDEKIHNQYLSLRWSLSKSLFRNKIILNLSRKILSQETRDTIKIKLFYKKNIKPELSLEYRKRIAKVFAEDVKNLEKFLGRDLPWPDFH